jgi:predicted ATPase/DNA-binding CsgD family transcriptional regulator
MPERARSPRASNLPAELTSFVGRRQELREVKRLLTTTRLLTLTGSGGAGKTRLAVRAAAEMARGFPDGVWLVSLGPIQDPLLVTQAVFSALGVHDMSAGLSLSTLADYLADKRLLLVLDNCEHLLDGCAVLASTLIKSCPLLHMLVTSRQALGVSGEVRMVVPPMSLPEAGDEMSMGRVMHSDAVWLLSERAAAAVPGFTLDAGNAATALSVCRRLDGIPLALELAAVRLQSLSLDQLNHGLATEFTILGSGDRSADPRQQTLEATIAWSYGLLDEQERLLWARLSVFAGGFDLDAAVAVCSDPRLAAEQVPGLLAALVEKSILIYDQSRRDPRYWLLQTLREYGRTRLREFDQETITQRRHFEWMRALGRSVGAWDGRQPELFHRMDLERANLWSALDFCLQQPEEIDAAAELAQHLMAYWACRGPFSDVRRILTSLAEATVEDSASRGRLLWVAAVMAGSQNDYDGCVALTDESLRIGTAAKDVEVVGWSLIESAVPRWRQGDIEGSADRFASALSLAKLMHIEQVEIVALNTLCGISVARGDLDRAIEFGERGIAISKNRGELWVRGYLLNFLAQANWLGGDKEHAEAQAREGTACKHAVDDRNGLTILLETLASMAAESQAHQRAATLLGCAQQVRDASSLTLIELFRPQHERSVSIIVRGLGQQSFDAAYARGRAMTIDDAVAYAVKDELPAKPTAAVRSQPPSPLTTRESEIARLVADNLSNKQIATKLCVAERTVETHITNILNKLGLNSRNQLTRWMASLTE